jgi:hypothetical protein
MPIDMRHLLKFTTIFLRCIPAFFRNRSNQAIVELANENGWRAQKVRAELAKLGISIGLATVSRYLPKRDPDHDRHQRWRTFLRNHRHGIAAMDFLVVPLSSSSRVIERSRCCSGPVTPSRGRQNGRHATLPNRPA